jgi:hypothetical protein
MPAFAPPLRSPLALPVVPPFERVDVSNLMLGGAVVTWELRRGFCEPEPYVFQLQYAEADVPDANWTGVGSPVTDTYTATDPTQRNFGKEATAHYRVKLTTDLPNVYYSDAIPVAGIFPFKELHVAKEIYRKELLNQRRVGVPGYFYKAKRAGTPCPTCLDPDLGQVTDSKCRTCFGLRISGGYYDPVEAAVIQDVSEHQLKKTLQKGPMDEPQDRTVRMLASPYPANLDVWVNKYSDERFLVIKIKELAELRAIPVVLQVTLHLAPFDDVIYLLERPD